MRARRFAALPMYDFPHLTAAHDALWSAIAARLLALGVDGVPPGLTRHRNHVDTWRDPQLLLGQACEYPLAKRFGEAVRLVATPRYAAPGCEAATYRSAILVRLDDPAVALADLRGRRCVVNELDSNSGMNLLRAAIAPIARGERFFATVSVSGAHVQSAQMLIEGGADVAAVDCVTFAHLSRAEPALTAQMRILAWTPTSPSLPYVTARSTDDATLEALRRAMAEALEDASTHAAAAALLLRGFDFQPDTGFGTILDLERGAAALGFPALA
jgi:ABC-type phosphate/phosphonate transport system substrate-binding protein